MTLPPDVPPIEPQPPQVPAYQAVLLAVLPTAVRRILRYLVGALAGVGILTALQGEAIANDPAVQAAITTLVTGLVVWAIEQAAALAKRWGQR